MVRLYNEGLDSLTFDEINGLLNSSRIFAETYINDLLENESIERKVEYYAMSPSKETFHLTTKTKLYAIEQGWITE